METLEVHPKDFLIKWVDVPDKSIIDWQVKPLKKSVNFAIYKRQENGDLENIEEWNNSSGTVDSFASASQTPSTTGLSQQPPPNPQSVPHQQSTNSFQGLAAPSAPSYGNRNRSNSVTSVNKVTEPFFKTKSRSSTLSNNINSGELRLIKNYNKLLSDELVHGKLDVSKSGVYAFIFDNSFSKTTGKKILFSSKILSNDSINTVDKFKHVSLSYPSPVTPPTQPVDDGKHVNFQDLNNNVGNNILRPKNGELLQSVLLKKRRKKLQGFVKRYFVLNLKYGTLSYFRVNDNKLRGQMPINQSIISANPKRLEIIIDSGMEAWDLKALNKHDFDIWIDAFNTLKKTYYDETNDSATFHKEIKYDDDNNTYLPSYIIGDLSAIQLKIEKIKSKSSNNNMTSDLDDVNENIDRLVNKLKGHMKPTNINDALSLFSSNDFYDAKDYIDETNGGVIQLMKNVSGDDDDDDEDDDDEVVDYQDDDDEGDDSSSSGSESSHDTMDKELSVIKETESRATTGGEDKDNSLYPLPHDQVERTCNIPEWNHAPPSILSFVRKNVGKDLTSIAMPVDMNEPVTILQKFSEIIEYSDVINHALQAGDTSGEKILRIAAFAVSSLSSVRDKERVARKPFNPLLGETFELVREDKGLRLISEKVCHRPPVFAIFVESKDWTLSFNPSPSQKFWGKTAEVITKGVVKLTIKSTNELFQWSQPTSMLKNIIAGEKYSEPTGSMTVKSSSGYRAVVDFAKGGVFSGRSEDLSIKAFDSSKKQLDYTVSGKWTESMTLNTNSTEKVIWTCGPLLPKSNKRFGFTQFAAETSQITDMERGYLAPTDSRLRPDIDAYLKSDIPKAEKLKNELEENQRTRRKELEQSAKKYKPMFFHHIGNSSSPDSGEWVYNRGEKSYWNRRANQDWDDLLKLW